MLATAVDPNRKSVVHQHLAFPEFWADEEQEAKPSDGVLMPSESTRQIYLSELERGRVPNWVITHFKTLVERWK